MTDFSANGSYESIANNFELLNTPDYAYMIRTTDLEKNNYEDGVKYINKHAYDFLSKSKLFGGEILINKIGSPGSVYMMPSLNRPVSLGMNLFMIRIKQQSGFNEKFIWVYLSTELGQDIIKRKINGTVPLTIDKEAIKTLYIPKLLPCFQNNVASFINLYEKKLKQSKILYSEAENLLLEELGLKDWKPKEEAVNIKTNNDFKNSGRLDAEYYQPKYDDLFDRFLKIETKHLGGVNGIVSINKSIEPGSEAYQDNGIPFIRVANLSKFGLSDTDIYLKKEEAITDLYPKKDTILLSKDGSVGIAYKVEKDLDVITSGAILHLKIKDTDFLPDYLTLVLNSIIVKMQAERDAGGSIIQHWKPSEIEKVIIPKFSMELQNQISEKIQESFRLRAESEGLLHLAKLAVETAIEKGEDEALRLIDDYKTTKITSLYKFSL